MSADVPHHGAQLELASWKEGDEETYLMDGHWMFPVKNVKMDLLKPSAKKTSSYSNWMGTASYYDIHLPEVDGQPGRIIPDGAWTYLKPNEHATKIAGGIFFYQWMNTHIKVHTEFDKTTAAAPAAESSASN